MKLGDVVNGSYVLEKVLGKNQAKTFLARLPDGKSAVLKILELGEGMDFRQIDLFKREAECLKSMDHPGIPRYMESFETRDGQTLCLATVQEYVEGKNLQDLIEGGKRFTEAEIIILYVELLGILSYIHSLRPQIVHRDVNPKNIILRDAPGRGNARLALVDFSGVQDGIRVAARFTATFVGTAGYTPMEQLAGNATARSDLYAAAATVLFLLSHSHPSELPVKGMAIDLDALGEIRPGLRFVLSGHLNPDPAKRNLGIDEAIEYLKGKPLPVDPPPRSANLPDISFDGSPAARDGSAVASYAAARPVATYASWTDVPVPEDCRLTLIQVKESPALRGPLAFSVSLANKAMGIFLGIFSVIWLSIVLTGVGFTAGMGSAFALIPLLFLLPFVAVGLFIASMSLRAIFGQKTIGLMEGGILYRNRVLIWKKEVLLPFGKVKPALIDKSTTGISGKGQTIDCVRIPCGRKVYEAGEGLADDEIAYLRDVVNSWIKANEGSAST